MNTPRDLKFYNKFQMEVREGAYPLRRIKNEHRLNPFHYEISDSMAYNASLAVQVEEVETVSIRMPKDQLEHLQQLLAHYEQNEHKLRSQAEVLAIYRDHERIRMANPIVKKAYEKYLMLLELVRHDTIRVD